MSTFLGSSNVRMVQFTGGTAGAEAVTKVMRGRVKLEDAGMDWKVLGPLPKTQASQRLIDYVAWQCDQDAYAASGQKCSAQSVMLAHEDWFRFGLIDRLQQLAARRSFTDLTLSPVLSHSTAEILDHMQRVCALPGSKILFGGKPITTQHTIPDRYGAFEPTAVLVDMKELLKDSDRYRLVTKELFGPFQIVAKWASNEEDVMLDFLSRIDALLTAAIVSHDSLFINRVIADTCNGTTFCGLRSRTTGGPPNHWFGPAGSPLSAGIASPEAVRSTWTCHREIVYDEGPIPAEWTMPTPS